MTAEPATILRAVDCEGSIVIVHACTPPTFGWQFTNPKKHLFDYGWANSEAEAVEKSQKLLKPSEDGKYPIFQVVEVEK